MKLINKMYVYTAVWLIPFILIGSLFTVFMIEHIVYEETEEFLNYEMERLIEYHQLHNDFPDFTNVAALLEDVKYDKPFFKDTLLLETGDNEMIPFRELWFSIDHNDREITIILRHLLPGRDDIIEGTLLLVTGLMLLIALFLYLTVNLASGKVWAPFYKTLGILTRYKINDPVPELGKTDIAEFDTLNLTLKSLLKKLSDDYRHNKEFNENASHELQTYLAVIRANAEKLLDQKEENKEVAAEIGKIHSAALRLSQVQKSLLLLSKINNREFTNNVPLNLADLLQSSLETFTELIELREIKLTQTISVCMVTMDTGLAETLINNLIKNAVKHNVNQGYINVRLNNNSLTIDNSGKSFDGDTVEMLQRFAKGEEGNIGIGLAIVKEICDVYRFKLSYSVDENRHRLKIRFNGL